MHVLLMFFHMRQDRREIIGLSFFFFFFYFICMRFLLLLFDYVRIIHIAFALHCKTDRRESGRRRKKGKEHREMYHRKREGKGGGELLCL